MLEGGAGAGSDKVFGLYEVTGRLGAMWNDLCPQSVLCEAVQIKS
jgi:hypothetical protein